MAEGNIGSQFGSDALTRNVGSVIYKVGWPQKEPTEDILSPLTRLVPATGMFSPLTRRAGEGIISPGTMQSNPSSYAPYPAHRPTPPGVPDRNRLGCTLLNCGPWAFIRPHRDASRGRGVNPHGVAEFAIANGASPTEPLVEHESTAGCVLQDEAQIRSLVIRQYPLLKKAKQLEWGYKIL
eukprot:1180146-Prorocentrum_minimum.AAC.4